MIVVTGASGFIGSCLISRLNESNFNYIIAVDDFSNAVKNKNLTGKKIQEKVHYKDFFHWLDKNQEFIEFIFHLAPTDSEATKEILDEENVNYSKAIWKACCKYQIPLMYSSSPSTCSFVESGSNDTNVPIPKLNTKDSPTETKKEFDTWASKQVEKPFYWAGLTFSNLYGPNEYYKDRTASEVYKAFDQIKKTRGIRIPKEEPARHFVYVKDVVEVIMFLMHHRKDSGMYHLGSSQSNTSLELAKNIFKAMGNKETIHFIDAAEKQTEQYLNLSDSVEHRLYSIGYRQTFTSLEEGVQDYVKNYLMKDMYY